MRINKSLLAALAAAGTLASTAVMAQVPQYGANVSQEQAHKAVAAALAEARNIKVPMYRRPTKAFQDALAAGGAGLRILTLRGASAVEGGLPLMVDGKIIGAIGVSGGSAEQDGVVAKAGADAMAAK